MGAENKTEYQSRLKDTSPNMQADEKIAESSTVKPDNVVSLKGYYETKEISPARFIAVLKNNKIRRLEAHDIQQCLAVVDERDPDLDRTLALLFSAIKSQSPIARQYVSFVMELCQTQLATHYSFDLEPHKPASSIFVDAFGALASKMTRKQPDTRALNILKLVGVCTSYSRGLNELDIIQCLSDGLLPKSSEKIANIPVATAMLFKPTTKIKGMTDLLTVAQSCLKQTESARQAALREFSEREKADSRAEQYQDQIEALKAELDRKERDMSELSESLQASQDEVAALEKTLAHEKAISSHSERELKGRARLFLDKKLAPLLDTAAEFAELEPPRKSIILERLELARDDIRREIEWLRSTG